MPPSVDDVLYWIRYEHERMVDRDERVRSPAEAVGLLHDRLARFVLFCRAGGRLARDEAGHALCAIGAVAVRSALALELSDLRPHLCNEAPLCAFRGCEDPAMTTWADPLFGDWGFCESHRLKVVRSMRP